MATAPNDSPSGLRRSAWPSSRVARSSVARVAAVGGAGPDAAGQLRRGVLVVAHPQRRRTPELDVELDGRIAHRLGEGGQLGQAVEPLGGPAQDGERVVAGREEDPPVGRRRDDRERLLDEPERLLGGVRGEGGRRGIDREARGPHGVAGRERVLGEHRQAGRGRVATVEQQVDDRGVDLPASGRRQLVRGELADLLVGEGVVGRLALGLREQEARHGRRARGRRRAGRHRRRRPSAGLPDGLVAVAASDAMSPSPTRARIARRSRRLKLRPRIAASPSAALVRAGSRAARRSMSVRTADGTSRAALRPSRHSPSICWSVPASRCVRASSSTMNGTPSDWTCMAAADAASTGPPRTRFRSSAVSTELNRPGRSRRTRPIRSMSATKLTASVTDANSSGRIVRNRKIGRSASLRTTYRRSRRVSSSAHWTSSMSSASGWIPASVGDRDAREVEGPEELGIRREASRTRVRHARRWPPPPAGPPPPPAFPRPCRGSRSRRTGSARRGTVRGSPRRR